MIGSYHECRAQLVLNLVNEHMQRRQLTLDSCGLFEVYTIHSMDCMPARCIHVFVCMMMCVGSVLICFNLSCVAVVFFSFFFPSLTVLGIMVCSEQPWK